MAELWYVVDRTPGDEKVSQHMRQQDCIERVARTKSEKTSTLIVLRTDMSAAKFNAANTYCSCKLEGCGWV